MDAPCLSNHSLVAQLPSAAATCLHAIPVYFSMRSRASRPRRKAAPYSACCCPVHLVTALIDLAGRGRQWMLWHCIGSLLVNNASKHGRLRTQRDIWVSCIVGVCLSRQIWGAQRCSSIVVCACFFGIELDAPRIYDTFTPVLIVHSSEENKLSYSSPPSRLQKYKGVLYQCTGDGA